ncbi:MAG: 2-phosphosulfolactate phosphatase, partial [Candidatus Hodarchaeota archaeon]
PVKEVEEARSIKATNPNYILAGERKNVPPPGFQFGNSPLDYLEADLTNRTVVFSSSNCTRVVSFALSAPFLALACYRNIEAVAKWCKRVQEQTNFKIIIVPANSGRRFSDEDVHCAICLKQMIKNSAPPPSESEVLRIIVHSAHGYNLKNSGFSQDLFFAAEVNKTSVVPIYSVEEQAFLNVANIMT